jgi:hypothetical protein
MKLFLFNKERWVFSSCYVVGLICSNLLVRAFLSILLVESRKSWMAFKFPIVKIITQSIFKFLEVYYK